MMAEDHTLEPDHNYGRCSCGRWSMSGTDLEVEAVHQRHIERADKDGEVCCVFCGTEDTFYRLGTNHGFEMGYANGEAVCMAMHLRRNQALYASRLGTDQRLAQLPAALDRAHEVWSRHPDQSWIAALEPLCRPLGVPEHHTPIDSEEVALF